MGLTFGKKKEAAKEAPVTSDLVEADVPRPPSKEEMERGKLVAEFNREYGGIVATGTDGVRASILFAIYAEQRRTNDLLERLIETLESMKE